MSTSEKIAVTLPVITWLLGEDSCIANGIAPEDQARYIVVTRDGEYELDSTPRLEEDAEAVAAKLNEAYTFDPSGSFMHKPSARLITETPTISRLEAVQDEYERETGERPSLEVADVILDMQLEADSYRDEYTLADFKADHGIPEPTPEPEPCEGEYCAIDLYHEWLSETRGEAIMGAVTQGYSIEGGHPHQAASDAVRGTTAPKPCSLCNKTN